LTVKARFLLVEFFMPTIIMLDELREMQPQVIACSGTKYDGSNKL
jgi:hypothetical protein